jgi:hypothetical protein
MNEAAKLNAVPDEAALAPVRWQRFNPNAGWLEVDEVDLAHYRSMGQEIRPLCPIGDVRELLWQAFFNGYACGTEHDEDLDFEEAARRAFAEQYPDQEIAHAEADAPDSEPDASL